MVIVLIFDVTVIFMIVFIFISWKVLIHLFVFIIRLRFILTVIHMTVTMTCYLELRIQTLLQLLMFTLLIITPFGL